MAERTPLPGNPVLYRRTGHCPICERTVEFTSTTHWYRDFLVCSGCGSIPRERALALVLMREFPGWRSLSIHESSPVHRGISAKLRAECPGYVLTQFFPGEPLGRVVRGARNENLEHQTFADAIFDIAVTLDVMEHVNQPDLVVAETARTLKVGGAMIFTTPTYKALGTTERRAIIEADGTVRHLAPPEYHGNPVSDAGSLVTFHFGYDLPELISTWSGMDVETVRFHDPHHGIIGEFTEVYVARRRPPP